MGEGSLGFHDGICAVELVVAPTKYAECIQGV